MKYPCLQDDCIAILCSSRLTAQHYYIAGNKHRPEPFHVLAYPMLFRTYNLLKSEIINTLNHHTTLVLLANISYSSLNVSVMKFRSLLTTSKSRASDIFAPYSCLTFALSSSTSWLMPLVLFSKVYLAILWSIISACYLIILEFRSLIFSWASLLR